MLTMEADRISTQPLVERRQLPRLTFTGPLQYRDLFKAPRVYSGSLARDLSAGGLRISSSTSFARDDRLVLLLSLPDSLREIRAIARVSWQRERPFASSYESGLQFIEITSEDRDSIADFVERGVVS